MQPWTVMNTTDGNDTFQVEGDNYGEAACEALTELGWALVENSNPVPDPYGHLTEKQKDMIFETACCRLLDYILNGDGQFDYAKDVLGEYLCEGGIKRQLGAISDPDNLSNVLPFDPATGKPWKED